MKRLLLVEGKDDQHVLWALCRAHNLPETFEVLEMTGVDSLLESIPVRLKAQNEDRLAVLLDADTDIGARWNALRSSVHRFYPESLPSQPDPLGTVSQLSASLTFGAWLMPDNTVPGILESFIRFMVPADDKLFPLSESFVNNLPPDLQRVPVVRRAKAHIHTWLALQSEPGKPLGQAITAKYLDGAGPGSAALISWLKRMFPP